MLDAEETLPWPAKPASFTGLEAREASAAPVAMEDQGRMTGLAASVGPNGVLPFVTGRCAGSC